MTLSEREQSAGPPARWVAIRPRTAVLRQVLVQVLAPQEGAAGAADRPCSPLWRAFGPGGGVGAERRLCAAVATTETALIALFRAEQDTNNT